MADRQRGSPHPLAKTKVDAEAKRLKEQEELTQHYQRQARAMMKVMIEDGLEPEGDTQDRRIAYIREAVPWAATYMQSQDQAARAQQSYKLGHALNNKATMDSATDSLGEALRTAGLADPELRRLLPHCHLGLILNVQEWRGILFLPQALRDLVGRDLLEDAEPDEAGLRLDLGPATVPTPAANGARRAEVPS